MRRLFLLLAVLLVPAVALAGPVAEGARAWDGGEPERAAEIWADANTPAASGLLQPSGVLLYDLGLAAYQADDLPRAIAFWRAAGRLRPRDARLSHNLARVRGRVDGTEVPVGPLPGWTAFVTVGEAGGLGVILLLLGAVGQLLRWRRRRDPLPFSLVAVAGLIVCAVALLGARAQLSQPVLVVVDAPAVVRDAARPDAEERFILQPGSEVRMERVLGDYVLVHTGDGQRGWVPTSATLHVDGGGSG